MLQLPEQQTLPGHTLLIWRRWSVSVILGWKKHVSRKLQSPNAWSIHVGVTAWQAKSSLAFIHGDMILNGWATTQMLHPATTSIFHKPLQNLFLLIVPAREAGTFDSARLLLSSTTMDLAKVLPAHFGTHQTGHTKFTRNTYLAVTVADHKLSANSTSL